MRNHTAMGFIVHRPLDGSAFRVRDRLVFRWGGQPCPSYWICGQELPEFSVA
jgi:hypothetical protein